LITLELLFWKVWQTVLENLMLTLVRSRFYDDKFSVASGYLVSWQCWRRAWKKEPVQRRGSKCQEQTVLLERTSG